MPGNDTAGAWAPSHVNVFRPAVFAGPAGPAPPRPRPPPPPAPAAALAAPGGPPSAPACARIRRVRVRANDLTIRTENLDAHVLRGLFEPVLNRQWLRRANE